MSFKNNQNKLLFLIIILLTIIFSVYSMVFGWNELYSHEGIEDIIFKEDSIELCSNVMYRFKDLSVYDVDHDITSDNEFIIDLSIENIGNQDIVGFNFEVINKHEEVSGNAFFDEKLSISYYETISFSDTFSNLNGNESIKSITIYPIISADDYSSDSNLFHCDEFSIEFSGDVLI